MTDLLRTPLFDLHQELGARMVEFAGYEMPVQYKPGVLKEHLACREGAGLFDVSHMGQVVIRHPEGPEAAAAALERLVPQNVIDLKPGRQRYGLFLNNAGGILDDLMIARREDDLFLVVNAACKEQDVALLKSGLPDCEVEVIDRALIALQGPRAEAVLSGIVPAAAEMAFMDVLSAGSEFGELWISRSGYTGEDGYEISVAPDQAVSLVRKLLSADGVEPVGLGARDSLRLEAGLCLYGHDLSTETTPVEADLLWAIQKTRRSGGTREGGFPGAETVLAQIAEGATRKRVGLKPEGRAPMREGVELFDGDQKVGEITSGGFGPTVGHPIAMGYVDIDYAAIGTTLTGEVRGKRLPVQVVDLPFRPATYKR
ncbi:glycine cleavage system aminomethyltransferase GcvT [Palleronia caenipelagi]|uniref:aminomethyltransferase n=1 Tax=Palleronia caenipelagi TaxID=2489174 RepID=A0A547PY27_9RHOB|nr:glycine cleavage system aminomethyltransferase GcvT [Palleronia caenipelagi]TRD18938.1 glycine cleavage system aminomethyltransferase GcvT [Palleronia caenipelagi]